MTPEKRMMKRIELVAKGRLPDVPIQWERLSSSYDFCPRCKIMDIWFEKKSRRWCPHCDIVFTPDKPKAHML